jgi:hypothetical protein
MAQSLQENHLDVAFQKQQMKKKIGEKEGKFIYRILNFYNKFNFYVRVKFEKKSLFFF